MVRSCNSSPDEEKALGNGATIHEEQDQDMAIFGPVLANLDFERVSSFVLAIRKRTQTAKEKGVVLHCSIQKEPLWGAFHVLFIITFTDDVKWLLKIPATGYPDRFDAAAARSLTSEALTMRYLKRETTMPLPEVYHFDASLDNEVHCPFILMEYIEGISCRDIWFNDKIPYDLLEQHRHRVLEDVAKSMSQLGRFRFHCGGQPNFDSKGNLEDSVSPIRLLDNVAMLKRAETDDGSSDNIHNIFYEIGPFDDPKSFLFASLDRHSMLDEAEDDFTKGMTKLLRLFLDMVPEEPGPEGAAKFVLAHPDFDSQNFIFSPIDGSLRGIIDWDGTVSKPLCLGNEVYPGWLTRDWDPAMYGYFMPGIENPENSPAELKHYRRVYRDFMEGIKLEQVGAPTNKVNISLTVQSLVVENLNIAAENPMCTYAILEKMFKEIARVIAPDVYLEMEQKEELPRAEEHCLEEAPNFSKYPELGDGVAEEDGSENHKRIADDEGGEEHCPAASTEAKARPGDVRDDKAKGDNDSRSESNSRQGEAEDEGREEEEEDDDDDEGGNDYDCSDTTEFCFYDVAVALARNNLDDDRYTMLTDGFIRLLAGD